MNQNKLRTSGRKLIVSMMKLTIIAVISAVCMAGSVRAAMAVASAYGPPAAATGATPPGGQGPGNVVDAEFEETR